ncbi:hypothetical protein BGP_5653 [Beggiatoa sp. PS]|nr:hypothetical protein BGP_5653 [Beggiatoa sp. PS]
MIIVQTDVGDVTIAITDNPFPTTGRIGLFPSRFSGPVIAISVIVQSKEGFALVLLHLHGGVANRTGWKRIHFRTSSIICVGVLA